MYLNDGSNIGATKNRRYYILVDVNQIIYIYLAKETSDLYKNKCAQKIEVDAHFYSTVQKYDLFL